jgi:hypothetical protein
MIRNTLFFIPFLAFYFFFFFLISTRVSLAQNEPSINGTFERGVYKPDGWSLSAGEGKWEREGYEGLHSISVTGTGKENDSNYWKCDAYTLLPSHTYRVSFMSRISPNASGGNVITGSNIANRDYQVGTKWEKRSFVFTTPTDTKNAFLRFGQWQKSGKVWFDNIEANQVVAIHQKQDDIELGTGESIKDGVYSFRHNLNDEGSNSARVLYSHTAVFNSNRWVMGDGSEVVYHHEINDYIQKNVSISIEIGYYISGKCIVEASKDGNRWQNIGELGELGRREFYLPDDMSISKDIFIRLRASSKDAMPPQFQIYGYSYKSKLEGKSITNMIGETKYADIIKANKDVNIDILSVGDLRPGGDNMVKLSVTNKGKSATRLWLNIELKGTETGEFSTEAFNVPTGETREAEIGYEIHKSGDFEIIASAITPNDQVLYSLRLPFNVSQLYDSNYGYTISNDEVCSVWWAESTHKISKERPVPLEKNDLISISSAKNEYESFQIAIRPEKDMNNISIETSPFINSSGFKIPSIDISLVGYVYVKVPTDRIGVVGYYPDPLPPYKEPFSVKAKQNQPIWVTVYVPSNAPAGDYRGKIMLKSGKWSKQVDISLHVWNFALPKEFHARSAFGFSPGLVRQYHNLETEEEYRLVIDKYYENFKAHHISPYNPTESIRAEFDPSNPDNVKLDFSAFDRSAKKYLDDMGFNTLSLPIKGLGGGTFHSRHYGELAGYKQGTPEYTRMFNSYLKQIQDHLEEKGWLDKAYIYWFDEPEPKDYDFVKETMDMIHQAAPKITRFLTEQPEPELYGYVELWCPITPEYNFERAEQRRQFGEHFWWYVCTGPKEPYCTLFIDHYATEMRVWLWQTWKYKVEGILVWQSNYWTSSLVYPEPNMQNPYDDPMSYVSGYGNPVGFVGYWGNGDGRFIYPPVEAMNGEKSLDGPVSSIRWEMLREGIEDYEYLWILANKVNELKAKQSMEVASPLLEEAEKLLEIPSDITAGMTEWTIDPKPIYRHRESVARMIEMLK